MRTQVNTYDGIVTWRECPTCMELISKYGSRFQDGYGYEGIFYADCVRDVLEPGQMPEDLLKKLSKL